MLDLEQGMAITVEAFREQAAGAVVALPPRHIPVPNGALRIVSGALIRSQRMGVRVGSAEQLARGSHAALLFDAENGNLLSVMDFPFGTLRTGATIGVATRFFARPDAQVVGMIGTGRNALSLLDAARLVRSIKRVRVYSRSSERRIAFAKEAQAALALSVEPADSTDATASGADIVYVATDSLTPVLRANSLSAGTFVAAMGRPSEIDPSVYLAADLVVVGHRGHEEGYHALGRYPNPLLKLIQQGQLDWSSVHEMCEVIVGRVPKRSSKKQVIIFKESGGGFGDIAFASWIYQKAREKGLGQEWDIG